MCVYVYVIRSCVCVVVDVRGDMNLVPAPGQVTHIAPADADGKIVGLPISQEGYTNTKPRRACTHTMIHAYTQTHTQLLQRGQLQEPGQGQGCYQRVLRHHHRGTVQRTLCNAFSVAHSLLVEPPESRRFILTAKRHRSPASSATAPRLPSHHGACHRLSNKLRLLHMCDALTQRRFKFVLNT